MEFISNVLLKDISYLWMIFFIMISAGLAKEHQLFAPAFAYVKNTFRSNRFVVAMLSAIGGILPIEGRVTVSAGLLDTVAPKEGHGREKLGIVDYLATHHYYLWSPLEKTVILPIAAFGLSYVAWLGLIAPLLVVSLAFITWYIWTQIHEEEVAIQPGKFKLSAVLRNTVPMVVAIGAYVAGASHVVCFGSLALYYRNHSAMELQEALGLHSLGRVGLGWSSYCFGQLHEDIRWCLGIYVEDFNA